MARLLAALAAFTVSLSLSLATVARGAERLPVVFAHGLGISWHPYETVIPLKGIFADHGYEVRVAHTPVSSTLEERARALRDEIVRLVPGGGKFHLMGHSMGGLDARYVVRLYPEIAARCVSVTTLSTPHHGSAVADWAVRQLDGATERAPELNAVLGLFGNDVAALRQLTTRHMNEVFNARVRDDARVRYFSFGFAVPSPVALNLHVPWLWFTHAILADAGRPDNDGLVDAVSARWGEFQGVYEGDHWSETGPIPIGARLIYRDTFDRALDLLDRRF